MPLLDYVAMSVPKILLQILTQIWEVILLVPYYPCLSFCSQIMYTFEINFIINIDTKNIYMIFRKSYLVASISVKVDKLLWYIRLSSMQPYINTVFGTTISHVYFYIKIYTWRTHTKMEIIVNINVTNRSQCKRNIKFQA